MAPFKGYEYNFRMKALNFDYIQLIWMCERFIHTDNARPPLTVSVSGRRRVLKSLVCVLLLFPLCIDSQEANALSTATSRHDAHVAGAL